MAPPEWTVTFFGVMSTRKFNIQIFRTMPRSTLAYLFSLLTSFVLVCFQTDYEGHAKTTVNYFDSNYDGVVVAGGDGSMHEVINHFIIWYIYYSQFISDFRLLRQGGQFVENPRKKNSSGKS